MLYYTLKIYVSFPVKYVEQTKQTFIEDDDSKYFKIFYV